MKNVKYGFQFGIGLLLAKKLWDLPRGLARTVRDYKKIEARVKRIMSKYTAGSNPVEEMEHEHSNVFPKCQNTIGFTID